MKPKVFCLFDDSLYMVYDMIWKCMYDNFMIEVLYCLIRGIIYIAEL